MKAYLESCEEVLKQQNSDAAGLSSADAAKRLEQYGHNKLQEGKKKSLLERFLGELADPMIIILIVAKAMDKYQNSPLVQNMFAFMRPAVTGLIAAAGFSVLKIALFKAGAATFFAGIDWLAVALFIVLLVLTQVKKLKKIHPIAFIAVGAVIGILFGM